MWQREAFFHDRQCILVFTEEKKCRFYLLQMHKNGSLTLGLRTEGYIGKGGAGKLAEGDKKTPRGLFTIQKAYGLLPDPGTALEYQRIYEDSYWCGDSQSRDYNRLVSKEKGYRPGSMDEHLIKYADAYGYFLDIGYNKEQRKNKGSAIFLHCETGSPTEGCIAIPKDKLKELLQKLKKGAKICII